MSSCDESSIKKNYIVQSPTDFDILSACTGFYTNNIYNCTGDTLTLHSTTVSANTVNASVYLSGGTNLLDIFGDLDNYTTGATLVGTEVVFDRSDTLSAYTLDLSSLDVNDTFVTGGTYNEGTTSIDFSGNSVETTFSVSLSGISSNIDIYNTYFVSPTGDDSTAVRGDLHNPFKTITAARNKVVAELSASTVTGDTLIYVYPGNYTDQEVQYENGNFYFTPNTVVTLVQNTHSNRTEVFRLGTSLVNTNNIYSANTCNVYGQAKFIVSASTDNDVGGGVIQMLGNSKSHFECDSAYGSKGTLFSTFGNSELKLKANELELETNDYVLTFRESCKTFIDVTRIKGGTGGWAVYYFAGFNGQSILNVDELVGGDSWQPLGFGGVSDGAEIVLNVNKLAHEPDTGNEWLINNTSQSGGKITYNGNINGIANGIVGGGASGGEFNYNGDILVGEWAILLGFPLSNSVNHKFNFNGTTSVSGITATPMYFIGGTITLDGSLVDLGGTGINGVSTTAGADLRIGNFRIEGVTTNSIIGSGNVDIFNSLYIDKPLGPSITTSGQYIFTGTTYDGDLNIYNTPTNDNSLTEILGRNSTTGDVEYRDVQSIISAATSQDTFVSGGTLNGTELDLTWNDGGSVPPIDLSELLGPFTSTTANNTIIPTNTAGNTNTAMWSTVAGGTGNTINSKFSFIGGGDNNYVDSNGSYYTSIVGGQGNVGYGSSETFIGGGQGNKTYGSNHTSIVGGKGNLTGRDRYSSIIGGSGNTIGNPGFGIGTSYSNFIGAGFGNFIGGDIESLPWNSSIVNGGAPYWALRSEGNSINSASQSFIGSGINNRIVGAGFSSFVYSNSVIVGGIDNTINRPFSPLEVDNVKSNNIIGGGSSNTISFTSGGFIGGGNSNSLSGTSGGEPVDSVVVGGTLNNIVTASSSFIGGGYKNNILRSSSPTRYSFIGGGHLNTVTDSFNSSIVGGSGNSVNENYSFIGGGRGNIINDGLESSIVGGVSNTINDSMISFIGGGINNTISGGSDHSSIVGGSGNTLTNADRSVIIGGGNITGTTDDTAYVPYLNVNLIDNDNSLTQILSRDSSDGTIKYRDVSSIIGAASADTFVTGFTYSPNTLTINRNDGSGFTANISEFSTITVTGLTVDSDAQFNDNVIVDGNTLIKGNVTILGTATTINSETVLIKDNILTLNSTATGTTVPFPVDSGLEILRNSATTSTLLWEESNQYWSAGLSGSTSKIILEGDSLSLLVSGHTHPIGEVIGLQSALDGKVGDGVNIGSGAGEIFRDKTGTTLNFRTLSGGSNTTLTTIGDVVKIDVAVPSGDNFFSTGGTVTQSATTSDPNISLQIVGNTGFAPYSITGITDTFVSGFTFSSNTFTISQNDGGSFDSSIETIELSNILSAVTFDINTSGSISATTISATTFYGDGSQLSGITDNDTFVTGGTVTGETTIVLSRTDNVNVLVTGVTGSDLFNTYTGDTETVLLTKVDGGNNVGGATEIFRDKTGTTLNFRTLSGGTNTTVTPIGDVNRIDVTIPAGMNTFVTGYTYNDNNTFTINDNVGSAFTATINQVSGLTVNGILSATTISGGTIFSGGTNLLTIIDDRDTFVTGTTFTGNQSILSRNDGSDVLKISGGTNVTITSGGTNLTVIDVSIPLDNNTFVTGGTYNPSTVNLDFSGNSGFSAFTVDVSALKDDTNTFITGFTYNDANTFTIGDSSGTTFDASINIMTGLTVNGESVFSGTGTDVVQIYGSGSTTPIFRVEGSAGELFSITDSLTGELFAVNNISAETILSINSDNTILWGDPNVPSLNTTVKKSINSGLSEIYSIPVSAYTGGFFEYTVTGSGARAGSIMSIFSGTSIDFNETATNDIGDTSGITFDMNISGGTANLTVSATTNSWEIRTIVRSI